MQAQTLVGKVEGGDLDTTKGISLLEVKVRCAFSDRNLHSRVPLVPTPARLKRPGV
jgi:hypothetical protein